MLGILRTICSIIAALCVAAVPFVGIFAGWFYVIFLGVGILVFFMLTMLLKYLQDEKDYEKKKSEGEETSPSDEEKK